MKIFSPSLKMQMRDCILAVIWPKKEIFSFFKDHSVPANALKRIERWKEDNIARATMITEVFSELSNQPDNGTMHFDLMLETLAAWSHFPDYWFKKEAKLDLTDAKVKIAALRSAKDDEISAAKKRKFAQDAKAEAAKTRHATLEEMKADFHRISIGSSSPQERGLEFEKFLTKMARFFEIQTTEAFRVKGTQIDGSIKFDGENYLIEAKWHDRSLSDEPLMAFCHKQEINMHGRGIFISINGVTPGCLHMLERAGAKRTILVDGEDIALVLNEMVTLPDMLDRKVRAAQTRGQFFVNPITGLTKIKPG